MKTSRTPLQALPLLTGTFAKRTPDVVTIEKLKQFLFIQVKVYIKPIIFWSGKLSP